MDKQRHLVTLEKNSRLANISHTVEFFFLHLQLHHIYATAVLLRFTETIISQICFLISINPTLTVNKAKIFWWF